MRVAGMVGWCVLGGAVLALAVSGPVRAETSASVEIRGRTLHVHLYGPRDGPPAVVASGDGGWIHVAPEAAQVLAAKGFFVVGVDSKAYLSSFTSGDRTLTPQDVPGDFRVFVDQARAGREAKVLLAGVSEGAGLAVLAASDPALQPSLLGVLALGLPPVNELGWRFRDSIIYVTKKVPNEPTFRSEDFIPKLARVPLAALHSSHDEFAPVSEIQRLMALPGGGPRRLWVIEAADHRFRDNLPEMRKRLLEAVDWMRSP